jgi:hypothetical protein
MFNSLLMIFRLKILTKFKAKTFLTSWMTDGVLCAQFHCGIITSVAAPESVERQFFAGAGAGAEFFLPGSCSGYVNSYKRL